MCHTLKDIKGITHVVAYGVSLDKFRSHIDPHGHMENAKICINAWQPEMEMNPDHFDKTKLDGGMTWGPPTHATSAATLRAKRTQSMAPRKLRRRPVDSWTTAGILNDATVQEFCIHSSDDESVSSGTWDSNPADGTHMERD